MADFEGVLPEEMVDKVNQIFMYMLVSGVGKLKPRSAASPLYRSLQKMNQHHI